MADGFPADAFVWRKGFEDWQRPDDVPEFCRRKPAPLPLPAKAASAPDVPPSTNSIDDRTSKGRWRPWIRSLMLVVLITAGAAAYRIYSELAGPRSEEGLRGHEADLKRQLPLQIDEITTLIDVKYEPTNSIYWYLVDTKPDEFDHPNVEQQVRAFVCANAETSRTIREKGYSYEFHYASKQGAALAYFKISACP